MNTWCFTTRSWIFCAPKDKICHAINVTGELILQLKKDVNYKLDFPLALLKLLIKKKKLTMVVSIFFCVTAAKSNYKYVNLKKNKMK